MLFVESLIFAYVAGSVVVSLGVAVGMCLLSRKI